MVGRSVELMIALYFAINIFLEVKRDPTPNLSAGKNAVILLVVLFFGAPLLALVLLLWAADLGHLLPLEWVSPPEGEE